MAKTTQKIKFLDVGHGDSSVIFLKDTGCEITKTVVIDISDADKAADELAREGIRILDILIISHFDADHCKGVNDFLKNFYQEDTNVQKHDLIEDASAKISIIYPNEEDNTIEYLNNKANNKSVVCILESAACTVLFPGDLEAEGWKRMLDRIPALKCDILKMPHHGAFYSDEKVAGTNEILK